MSICLLVAPFARDARGVLSTSVQVVAGLAWPSRPIAWRGVGGAGGCFLPSVRSLSQQASRSLIPL